MALWLAFFLRDRIILELGDRREDGLSPALVDVIQQQPILLIFLQSSPYSLVV